MGANASHEPLGPDATRGSTTKPHNPGNLFSPYGRASIRKSLRRRKSKKKQKENQNEDTSTSQVEGPNEAQLRKMDKLKKSLRDSFRKKKEVPESSKPHLWQSDEAGVRAGTCSFLVKYMGCVEVYESRGMQVCEEALKVLRNSRRRPIRGILYVSGDGLRVVDDDTKGLLVDQTIEKVSFCAPDRNHERGFSYICRDGTTRRWMCHGFIAVKESGERLSHAVGCAFAACLERKQKRDKECGVTMTFDQTTSTFTRMGSFRQMSVTERLSDPQECKPVVDPVPVKKVENPHAIARPHATPQLLQRQGSFRVFNHLNQSSPFKRQLSLRLSDLPSNIERTRSLSFDTASFVDDDNDNININNIINNNNNNTPAEPPLSPTEGAPVSPQGPPRTQRSRLHSLPIAVNMAPIPESSPLTDPSPVATKTDAVSAMCQQVSAGLSLLSNFTDDIISPPSERAPEVESLPTHLPGVTGPPVAAATALSSSSPPPTFAPTSSPCTGVIASPPSPPAPSHYPPSSVGGGPHDNLFGSPVTSPPPPTTGSSNMSKGEEWLAQLNSQASQEISGEGAPPPRRHPPLSQLRSSSLGSCPQSDSASSPQSQHQPTIAPSNNFSTSFSPSLTNGSSPPLPMTTGISPFPQPKHPGSDPFDAEWVALSTRGHNPNNPFLQNSVTKAFQVQM